MTIIRPTATQALRMNAKAGTIGQIAKSGAGSTNARFSQNNYGGSNGSRNPVTSVTVPTDHQNLVPAKPITFSTKPIIVDSKLVNLIGQVKSMLPNNSEGVKYLTDFMTHFNPNNQRELTAIQSITDHEIILKAQVVVNSQLRNPGSRNNTPFLTIVNNALLKLLP